MMNICNDTQGDASAKYTMGRDHFSDHQDDNEYM